MKKLFLIIMSLFLFGGVTITAESVSKWDYDNINELVINNKNTKIYKAGKYKVGTNINPGEYLLLALEDRGAYYALLADSNGDDILNNGIFYTQTYTEVNEGEYLELSRCIAIPIPEKSIRENFSSSIFNGVFKVGVDLPAGEYVVESLDGDQGYWSILDSSGSNQDIISNEMFENSTFVTVQDGQYLELSRAIINLAE